MAELAIRAIRASPLCEEEARPRAQVGVPDAPGVAPAELQGRDDEGRIPPQLLRGRLLRHAFHGRPRWRLCRRKVLRRVRLSAVPVNSAVLSAVLRCQMREGLPRVVLPLRAVGQLLLVQGARRKRRGVRLGGLDSEQHVGDNLVGDGALQVLLLRVHNGHRLLHRLQGGEAGAVLAVGGHRRQLHRHHLAGDGRLRALQGAGLLGQPLYDLVEALRRLLLGLHDRLPEDVPRDLVHLGGQRPHLLQDLFRRRGLRVARDHIDMLPHDALRLLHCRIKRVLHHVGNDLQALDGGLGFACGVPLADNIGQDGDLVLHFGQQRIRRHIQRLLDLLGKLLYRG
mmetsp:Transcript_108179/g.312630  ORF Transcript_108179/g.312630 Transcript_108179/m.312630 type:complete len:340 (+) Transcript_108179:564-1583(+)